MPRKHSLLRFALFEVLSRAFVLFAVESFGDFWRISAGVIFVEIKVSCRRFALPLPVFIIPSILPVSDKKAAIQRSQLTCSKSQAQISSTVVTKRQESGYQREKVCHHVVTGLQWHPSSRWVSDGLG